MPLLLIRHGPTAYNSSDAAVDRLRGPRIDLPLTPEGIQIAHDTAEQLADVPITALYTSPLRRATDTAALIGHATNTPVMVRAELLPWDYGELSGRLVREVQPLLDNLVSDPTVPAPGGESFYQFLLRYLPFVMPLVRGSALVAAVSHGRNLKAVEAHLSTGFGLDLKVWKGKPMVQPGGAVLATPQGVQPFVVSSAHAQSG